MNPHPQATSYDFGPTKSDQCRAAEERQARASHRNLKRDIYTQQCELNCGLYPLRVG